MKYFNLTNVLIVIILALLVYLALKPDGSKQYLDLIEQENEKIVKQLEANQSKIDEQLNNLKVIEKKETIIRNYYNEVLQELNNVNTSGSANSRIRVQLDSLGSARF